MHKAVVEPDKELKRSHRKASLESNVGSRLVAGYRGQQAFTDTRHDIGSSSVFRCTCLIKGFFSA